jgi:predicted nucleotidyltransferase
MVLFFGISPVHGAIEMPAWGSAQAGSLAADHRIANTDVARSGWAAAQVFRAAAVRPPPIVTSAGGAEVSHNGTWSPWTHCGRNGGRRSSGLPSGAAHSRRVFGSVVRGEANENSDLDLLVAWQPGRSPMDHAGLVQDLQELLGMKVHVGTEKSLHWYVRGRILAEATPL